MSLRIIAGRLGGRRIQGPDGGTARPTTDRVREALFNLLHARMSLHGACVLDLFAGTGALAYEAMSRGASSAVLVDRDGQVLKVARQNAEHLGIESSCRFERTDVYRWLETNREARPFDLILADPPYHDPDVTRLPEHACVALARSGWLVLEHNAGISFDDRPEHVFTRTYGGTGLSFFQHDE